MRLLREEETVIAGIPACVRYKNIKNLYLRVRPPDGHIELSVPCHTTYADMENFISHRRAWIDERRRLICARAENDPPCCGEGEHLRLWGKEYRIMHPVLSCAGDHMPNAQTERLSFMRRRAQMPSSGVRHSMPSIAQNSQQQSSAKHLRARKLSANMLLVGASAQ